MYDDDDKLEFKMLYEQQKSKTNIAELEIEKLKNELKDRT